MYFSFLFIGRELSMWPANDCLQISVLLQMIFCSCIIIEAAFLCEKGGSVLRACREWFDIFSWSKEPWLNLKQLLNLVITNYCDFSVSCGSIICLSLWLWQISGNGNHTYVLHISLYDSPLCRLSTGQRSFAFRGAKLWNSLNDNI